MYRCESAGYQKLLSELQEENELSKIWIRDWVASCYGVDGLPAEWFDADGEIDEEEAPKNLLKRAEKTNGKRWDSARLQKPMEIVFTSWAGDVAVKKLCDALKKLSSVRTPHRQFSLPFFRVCTQSFHCTRR